jgi:hypothetical protein
MNLHTTVNYLLELAYQALITDDTNVADLLGTPVHLGMDSADLQTTHAAIIVPSFKFSDGQPFSGNWQMDCHIKAVTAFDDSNNPLPAGFSSLRRVHEQRAGYLQDLFMVNNLDQLLSSASLSVSGFLFSDVETRIETASWVTEFIVTHKQVAKANLNQ